MKVFEANIKDIKPYDKNPRVIPQEAIDKVANSIREFGFQQPIVVDRDMVVIVGHTRLKAAESLRLGTVPCVIADKLTEEQVRAYRLADNKTNEFTSWDMELLDFELGSILDIDMESFGFDFALEDEEKDESENPYTMNVDAPVYNITGETPELSSLVDTTKADELIAEIERSKVPEEVKNFLRTAAYRHSCFNYRNIAEYYAHADKDVQELMEKSALVIIDFQSAIKQGFVKLSKRINELVEETDE